MRIAGVIDEILEIVRAKKLSSEELFLEAEFVDKYQEWVHIELLGYRPEHLRIAAELLS